jgi:hypothetical protein
VSTSAPRSRAIAHAALSSSVLPIPAAPSTVTTAPSGSSSSAPIAASSSSRSSSPCATAAAGTAATSFRSEVYVRLRTHRKIGVLPRREAGQAARILRLVETTPRIHIELDLDLAAGPITGVVTTALGREAFTGWLELTAALERIRSGAPSQVAAT